MDERRKFERLERMDTTSSVCCAGITEDVKVFDVSAGGMKISFPKQVAVGDDVHGKLQVVPDLGPFYIRGKVARVDRKENCWETAVSFERVSTLPFAGSIYLA